MAWVSRTAVLAAALIAVSTGGAATEYSYEPGARSDPWGQNSIFTDPHWLLDQRTGCMAYDSNAGAGDTISWSGACPFGRADGSGTLTFYDRGRIFEQLTGKFDSGVLEDGRVSITWADGSHYDGEEKNGQFNGYGVLINSDGTRYDGLWQNDKFVDADDNSGHRDEVAGASGTESQSPANESSGPGAESANHTAQNTQAMPNKGLPPPNDIPFKMSTAPAKPLATSKPQPPAQTVAKQQPKPNPPPAQAAQASRKWAAIIGKHPRLVSADGAKLNLSIANGALARELKRPDGSVAKDSLVFVSETTGAVRDESGDAIATFQLKDRRIAIDYSDGSSEIVAADPKGLSSIAETKGARAIETRWYPEGHRFSRAERRKAARELAERLAAQRIAQAKAEHVAKQETRAMAPTPVEHVTRPEIRVAQAPRHEAPPSPPPPPVVTSAVQPMPKPESIAAATDLPTPEFKPALNIAAYPHKRHAESPVRVAGAETSAPAATERQPSVTERQDTDKPAPQTPNHVAPVREAEAITARPAHKPPTRPALARATTPQSQTQTHEPPVHATAVREAEAPNAPESQTPPAIPTHEPRRPPVVHPAAPIAHVATVAPPPPNPTAAHVAPPVTHVASVASPAPNPPAAHPTRPVTHIASAAPPPANPPAAHVVTLIKPTPALRVAPAPPPAQVAAKSPATTPPPRPTTPTAVMPAPVHVATTTPAVPVVRTPSVPPANRVAMASPPAPAVHLTPPAQLAPAVAHVTTTPPPTPAVAHVAPAPPTPAVAHAALSQAAATAAANVAAFLPPPTHTLLPQTSAPTAARRSASECLSLVSNGTRWGFRNNCDNDIQFAYCIMNGTDRLTACGDSAVPGSVAGHGFTSLVADLSIKDSGANRSFRWVGCNGGAGEVVPRLDSADPPMGRCLHASDLPKGAERADAGKKLAK